MEKSTEIPDGYRSGYAVIAGLPNAGKSTLLNALLGQKLSIVTRKPQTTRQSIRGILSEDDYQIIFLDTPGMLKPRYKLQEFMAGQVKQGIDDADIIIVLIDLQYPEEIEDAVLESLVATGKPALMVLNKTDLFLDKIQMVPLLQKYHDMGFAEVIPAAVLKDEGVDLVLQAVLDRLPEGPPYYPPDMVAEQPERFFAAEFIRESIFELVKKEVPYSTAVVVDPFKSRGKKIYIHAHIIVERDSQKGIIIGKKGEMLKELGIDARNRIEAFLQEDIFLELRVRVDRDWKKDQKALKKLGYGN